MLNSQQDKYKESEKNLHKWNDEVDVIVIGSGFAGLAAAISAREVGASVMVLEKQNHCGGNSLFSDGVLATVNPNFQGENGLVDSPDLLMQDMLSAGRGYCDEKLVNILAHQANEVFQWLVEDIGCCFQDRVDKFGGHSMPRSYTPCDDSGKGIIKPMLAKFKSLDGKIKPNTSFREFLTNEKNEITGVVIQSVQQKSTLSLEYIKVGKGVVLATGGFSGDISFRIKYDRRLNAEVDHTNIPNTTAQGMLQAVALDAQTVNLNYIQLGPWTSPDEKSYGTAPIFASYAVFQYGFMVDVATGKRFVNELADRKTCTDAMFKLSQPSVGIADAQGVELAGKSIKSALRRGVVKKFETLENLAEAYNIPVKTLCETLLEYNTYVETQCDVALGKPIPEGSKPLKPPFYGVRLYPKVHHTMGGLKINADAQVLNSKEKPIKGLYAAGEVTGGVHGACRLSTLAITDCLVFGRIAGRNVAKE
ncbi:MAG: flavocytochrome c [Okeania sp. SIO2F4]|uniref:flavocytochrome c n=1 Tax=Okeania sp. SIO2F4 TaxID=2607790 RepID=UPI00142ACB89|nr:flavocytochrome c [Okeania sp. SIO2F4]NES02205.1 flavocytochrome c [Okeania sp. SIO2F4]